MRGGGEGLGGGGRWMATSARLAKHERKEAMELKPWRLLRYFRWGIVSEARVSERWCEMEFVHPGIRKNGRRNESKREEERQLQIDASDYSYQRRSRVHTT